MISIRPEGSLDIAAIHHVESAAFGRDAEAALVNRLRELNGDFISLVAIDAEQIVGHICFSRVSIDGGEGMFSALAPLAVLPPHQRRGIGSMLVRAGLDECRRQNVDAVFVIGDCAYYSRFGFTRAGERGVRCEFDVPDEAFRLLELRGGSARAGLLRYPQAFHAA